MTLNLIEALSARQVPVDLVLAKAEGELLSQVPRQVRLFDLDCRRVRAALPGLIRYLRGERPFGLIARVDHANVVASMATALAAVRTRLVVTAASRCLAFPDSATISPLRALIRRRTLLPVIGWAYGRANSVAAVSQGIADELVELLHLDRDRIRVICNPVVTPQVQDLARERPAHPWLHDQGSPVILSVGRFVWEKDHATLLRSFAFLLRKRPARLLMLGEGPLRPELQRLCRTLGLERVCDMPGYCSNPYAAMARADLLVLSSRSEGSPNVLAEALACGCPVVATDCPSGPSEVLDEGRYGCLVRVGDANALAGVIHEALKRPWNRDDLRRRAAEYSNDSAAGHYLDALGYPTGWRNKPSMTVTEARRSQGPRSAA